MTHNLTKDMILHTIGKQLVRDWRTRVLSAAHSSALTSAQDNTRNLSLGDGSEKARRWFVEDSEESRYIHGGNTEGPRSAMRVLRYAAILLLMMVLGVSGAWGQGQTGPVGTDYSGYHFIANYNGYKANSKSTNFYLIPSIKDYIDADSEQPFLTTYKSYNYTSYDHPSPGYANLNNGCPEDHSLWQIIYAGNDGDRDYWYLKHVSSSMYLCFNSFVYSSNKDRARVHLESKPENSNEDKWKFSITAGAYASTTNPLPLAIIPKGETKSLNPAKDCKESPFGTTEGGGGSYTSANGEIVYFGGIVGYYDLINSNKNQPGSHWILETPVCETPVITYEGGGNISISTTTPGATIYYTMGDSPNAPSGTETTHGGAGTGTAAFAINEGMTIKAIAVKDHYNNSVVAEKSVTKVATPVIADNGEHAISITCDTEGATIYYTTDGTAPSTASSEYSTPLTDASNKLIRAIAVKDQCIDSDERPVITKEGMTYTITCPFPTEATIYYSTDGSEPTTIYGGSAISFTDSDLPFTVKAIAKKTDYNDSEIGSKYFGTNLSGNGTPTDPYLIKNAEDFEVFVDLLNEVDEVRDKFFKIDKANVNNGEINLIGSSAVNSGVSFSGTFDGEMVILKGLSHPLFTSVNDGTVKNVMLDNVNISGGTNVGAICNEATGDTRIFNCGVLASNSTVTKDEDGYDEITSSSSISGSNYVGGIVGLLDGSARVINCFSYAEITGGSYVGGIVGWNNVATTSANLATMVMNCMFYGDITNGTSKAPIYNGEIITNDGDADGVNNFNYFWAGASYVQEQKIDNARYNCALAAETRFLQRFEFFRHLLNSNRELAAWWATGSYDNKDEMMKWVMEPSQIGTATPYPILKAPDRYPSVVNVDVNHSETYKGRDLTVGPKMSTTLSVTIQNSTTDAVFGAPTGADITTPSLSLNIMDKDPDHFNFNYYKVQLPYYNDVGTGNYTGNRVVTGWKIVSISGGTTTYSTDNDNNDATPADAEAEVDAKGDITLTTPYNFADRNCTDKDKFGVSGRVFSQGAYWDVPKGVTAITIEPYWGRAVYLSDAYWDVTYKNNSSDAMATAANVTTVGGGIRYENGKKYNLATHSLDETNGQIVYTSISNAIASTALYSGIAETTRNDHSVYDYAVVLVGNYHYKGSLEASNSKPYTFTSIDLDGDNEPDYSYILRFDGRLRVHPVRIDFLNAIGLGMAQKSTGGTGTYNFGIMQPKGWFESTNTSVFRFTQFEYDPYDSNTDGSARTNSPMILQGGVIEQWVTIGGAEERYKEAKSVSYYHVGGNVWFKEFHIGVHQDKNKLTDKNPNPDQFVSAHPPISVTGGDFDEFYLTGLYNTPNNTYDDNAECYINGGRFGKVAGTGMQGIGVAGRTPSTEDTGNIIWQIDNADIDEFYAGGINAAHIAEGNIYTVITNSRVDQFCGGPKFGNMNSNKKVVTNAENCTFRAFFGAGYGGNSYNRRYPDNKDNIVNLTGNNSWNSWVSGNDGLKYRYDSNYSGVETRIDYQFIPRSNNTANVARLFVDYVSFSLATTHDVTSKLTGCTITTSPLGRLSISNDYKCLGSFYGGGSLGMVDGPVKSTLTNCIVEGNVFGGGYSATLPSVAVMNNSFQTEPFYDSNLGAYLDAKLPTTVAYTWEHATEAEFSNKQIDKDNHILYTTEDLTGLGAVTGNVTLIIDGNTTLTNGKRMSVAKSVYGGGEESNVEGNTSVNITGGTITQNVFGGGKGEADEFSCSKAMIGVNNAGSCEDPGSEANKDKGTTVTISNGQVNGNVYGGGEVGRVEWNTQVKIGVGTGNGPFAPVIEGSVFGAGKGKDTHGYAALVRGNSTVTIQGNAKVKANVYGGGEQSTVGRYWVKGIPTTLCSDETAIPTAPEGLPNEMPYKTRRGGKSTVIIQGSAQIGPDDAANISNEAGHVFGAGKGVTPNYVHTGDKANWSRRMVDYNSEKHTGTPGTTWDYYPDDHSYVWEYFATEDKYLEFLQTLALVTGTDVTIGGGTVKGNVYGGSESGFVQDDTDVKFSGGTIGTEGTTTYGNIFGGGKGLEASAEAGKVKGNTGITISGGTTNGNVYGGGELGDVGTIDKTDINNYTWSGYGDEDTTNDTGKCTVSITNTAAIVKGNVFGAGKGSGVTFQCEKAMAYNTEVTISAGTVNGNVYGGGEVGRVENNSKVKVGSGDGVAEGTPTSAPDIKGSVFGAGKGLATHGYSALVRGNTEVTIEGNAKVGKSVYGGGEIASVGRYGLNAQKMPNILLDGGECKVNVQGYAVIGPVNASDDKGNVFGAGKGVDTPFDGTNKPQRMTLDNSGNSIMETIDSEEAYKSYLETLALATKPLVTIGGHTTINGSVYGGGELGLTKGSVIVTINGGTIEKDVYGGGALANTNTTHDVGVKENGVWKKENGEYVTTTVHPTTEVKLLGGLIKRDVFGGGLGQLGDSPIAAIVDGDVTVELNNNNGTCQVNGSVFGSNNINGTPKGHVLVHVFKTVKAGNTKDPEKTTLSQRWSENATYDLAAVYGGGNKADYEPTSVTDYTEVIIEGCDETSIKEVYGGGYGAAVPATQVKILGAYLINEVFGGGYGAGANNDGANVGYYTYKNETDKTVYTGFTDNDGNGKSQVKLYGGKVYTAYGGSNTKGNIRGGSSAGKATDIAATCSLEVKNIYGAGKNADQDGGTDLVIGCIPGLENVYGGAKDANIKGGVNLVITGGDFVNVFGGNDTSGTIQGPIKVFIEEDCDAINITNLYLGGNQAAYSVYGYYKDTDGILQPRKSATDTNPVADGTTAPDATTHQYPDPQLYVTKFTKIDNVYGGGYGSGAVMYGNPTVNINEVKKKFADGIGEIGNVYGGGDAAKVEGNTTVNIGTEKYAMLYNITASETDVNGYYTRSGAGTTESPYVYTVVTPEAPATSVTAQANTDYYMPVLGAKITGNVYGGGNLANVTGNTQVNICAVETDDPLTTDVIEFTSVVPGSAGVTIARNVFGGGKGIADSFTCAKAMVGIDGAGADADNYPNYSDGNTTIIIGNGTVGTLENGKLKEGTGNVYGGGEIGRVEMNTTVKIGTETGTSSPVILGDVFGGGKGDEEHGYAALVRGNPTVIIQANAKVGHNVYGGGEIASVARYKVPKTPAEVAAAIAEGYDAVLDMPYALKDANSGFCDVKVLDNAIIGPDTPMMMYHAGSNGNIPATDTPDDAGHVFGAGKGVLPKTTYDYQTDAIGSRPRRRINENGEDKWQWFQTEEDYIKFIQTLALSSQTTVTIGDDTDNNCKPFIKGSVYGGSENGLVQFNTNVYIKSGQIGWGKYAQDNALGAYDDDVWADNYTPSEAIDLECPHWDYGIEEGEGANKKKIYAPYDPNANATGDLDKYPPITGQTEGKSTEGGRKVASDGHTFYGNVFGGGSGSVPYFDTKDGISKYLNSAGTVKGNTNVTISGGHILTNVYGGCEATNVLGKATIKMTKGTIGVPRTKNQIIAHPVTCYLFGAGKGDQRIFFNKDTNVDSVEVEVTGGRIYGSVFGGGEDGHVMRDVKVTIGQEGGNGPKIGTLGSTYVDGNVFGGGRGFGGEALTAGNVGGTIDLIINGGEMLGSVYGGGRLASVGYGLYLVDEEVGGVKPYGVMRPDNVDDKGNTVDNFKRGYITVTVNGGTIGKEFADDAEGEHSGNVFGGSMGRLTKLDGTPFDRADHWALLATAKSTTVNINGGTIKRSVYGGGEMGTVTTNATVNVSGGTIGTLGKGRAEFGNVYGGGKGYVDDAGTYATAGIIKGNTKVTINSGTNGEPKIYHNIYGGGAYGSVGTITYDNATYVPNQAAAVSNMPTAWERAAEGTTKVNTGTAEVYVYGGTIGTNGNENGMVFGSSRGDVGTPVNGIDPNNRLAWVYNTKVVIGGEGKSPIVYGSVYGSGENGHVFENTQVDIHSGTMGVTTDDSFGGPNYRLRGNVYGGGCGEDTYPGTTGTTKENFNPLAGIVLGTTNVMIDGGQVVHNVYGAGALGSATNTSVTIAGNAVIGVSGKNGGNVFGAARGKEGITIVGSNLANSIETAVNINGGQIWGSVYGGGETGNVKQDVNVSMTGGAVAKDVYGGGALAHTQTANWDMTNASWLTDKISTTPNGKTTTTYKTHVSLTGGTITGDAYGGALGRKAVDGIAAVGTEGQDGYTPAVPAITAVEAMVYGDVLVELNGKTTVSNGSTSTTIVGDNAKGCIVNRVFGCNNLNGTPKGKVKVYVYATQKNGESDIVTKAVKNTNTYDVQAVYGGGNLAVYEPVDATLEYNDANKARVDAAYPEVVIDGCKVTSIKQVYGGGNAASVPATFVEIRRCYEIDEVFGGGNGFDNYSVEERGNTVWYENSGANVGYYTYATYPKGAGQGTGAQNDPYKAVEDTRYAGGADNKAARLAATDIQYGSGIARLEVKGGTIHTSYGGSNSKGNVRAKLSSAYSAMFDDCEMQVAQSYGGGKNAYSDAETDMVADCAKGVKEMFGGAKDADMDGDINMLITNGSSLERVFGGNNTSGAVNGSITITLQEGGCEPIKIGELYAGGFLAPYSVYGYEKNEDGSYKTESVKYLDENNVEQTKLQRIPLESGTRLYKDPRINVISATSIGNIFGGGYQAKLVGNPHINVNMTTGFVKVTKTLKAGTTDEYIYKDVADNTYAAEKVSEVSSDPSDPEAKSYIATTDLGTIGNIYGGGNMADIVGDTYVEIGTGKWVKFVKDSDGKVTEVEETLDRNGAKITGNVFGGGKGKADTFLCEKAMIGKDGDGVNNPDGGTHVTIGNGTVDGNVYGGGEIGRVEKNTVVTIGLADAGSDKSKPVIKGSVFGGGKGEEEHGYAALVRGNPTVIIQADAKVEHNVYGGGEIASVARYNVPRTEEEVEAARVQGYDAHLGMPYALANTTSGNCKVTVKDNAIIGPDEPMKMYHSEITDGSDKPDDAGHVFGAGKGILPQNYTYVDKEHKPKRMVLRDETIHTDAKKGTDWDYVDPNDNNNKNVWEYFADRDAYIIFIQTLALSSYANVTIGDDTSKPFVKGSVYGGSENGLVQFDTKVYIKSGQIGCGKNATAPYGDDVWADGYVPTDDLECASWDYGTEEGDGTNKKIIYAPYDPKANAFGNLDQYPGGKSTEGGRRIASDGHTYYGNVFGGGSGSVPYFDTTEGISKYLNSAGTVKGDTYVEISGGHILTNVYGGCEATNVVGTAKVTMTGGTLGVPRTPQQIKDHPVTCYLFGAGKGDQRIYFNKETNVNDAIVNVEGGRIYGSVFGGGEDGHVLRNTTVTIGKTDGTGPKIGTVGSTYVDGNVFGGGRGFGGEALTAGNVGGSVDLIINGGTMLGSVYGGGRLASVGYGLYLVNEEVGGVKPYGKMREDNEYDGSYPDPSPEAASAFYTKGRGHITVNINGGTIGSDVEDEHSGNVFGGSMGRLTKIDGSPFDDSDHWSLLATAKTTEVKIAGGTIKRNVYGGGEMGTVIEKATVNISGGTIGKAGSDNVEIGNVFGGGKGYLDPAQTYVGAGIVKGNTNVAIQNGTSGSTTTTPTIYQNVYGGGELGYVGMFTTPDHKEYTWTENTGLCTVEVAGGMITGHVFGAGKGHDDTFECERAMVRTTSVAVSDGTVGGNVYGGGEVGRVDQNSAVTIGPATGDSAPTITGSVFGAGAGVETHGYSALVRGNTAVVVQGNAKVGNSVYGGGQIAAVGRYGLDGSGMPSTLVNGGECVVTVQGNAVIGANGIGNVFGAGMGVDESKKTYTYADNANRPKRMMTYASGLYTDANKALWEFSDATHTYVWEYFDTKTKYLNFLQTLALATDTRLTINGNASVKGSVYGGSESGFVQRDTEVKILGGEILTVKDAAGNITEGNVFGGGKGISDNDAAGRVRSDTRITVLDGTINGDVYGGGALGKANTLSATNTTIVNLLGGTINGDVYGGGLGNATTAADVGNTKWYDYRRAQ